MYVESGYLVKSDDDTEIVFVEVKRSNTDIAHCFYEINYSLKNKILKCREVYNPIEYMQSLKNNNICKIENQEKLENYVEYLYDMGIIKSTNEYKVYRSRTFSLKNKKYGTAKSDIFKKK